MISVLGELKPGISLSLIAAKDVRSDERTTQRRGDEKEKGRSAFAFLPLPTVRVVAFASVDGEP